MASIQAGIQQDAEMAANRAAAHIPAYSILWNTANGQESPEFAPYDLTVADQVFSRMKTNPAHNSKWEIATYNERGGNISMEKYEVPETAA